MASITVTVAVDDVGSVLEAYDQIQVFRSESGIGGPYVEITADAPTQASLTSSLADPYATLNGKTLTVRIDGGTIQTVTIEEPNIVFIDPLVTELNNKLTDVVASNDGTGRLKLTSNRTGTQSIVEIVSGNAMAVLGFTAGQRSTGKDRRITMQEEYTEFTFVDNGGSTSFYYEVRFYNSDTTVASDFSDPIPGSQASPISSELATATIDLVGLSGEPLGGRLIQITNVFNPTSLIVSAHGVLGGSTSFYTDASGHGEIDLVVGTVVDVTIAGTGITRRITVPVGPTFDLLSEIATADDLFQIQTPPIADAPRRS